MPRRTVATALPLRYQEFLEGTLNPRDLTWEELTRGQLADRNGHFSGRPPAVVPRTFHTACVREIQRRLNQRFAAAADEAVDTLVDVMRNGEGEQFSQFERGGTQRLAAAKYIIERVIGKVPDKLEVTENVTVWQGMQEGGELLVDIDAPDDVAVVEVEAIEPPLPRRRARRTPPPSDIGE